VREAVRDRVIDHTAEDFTRDSRTSDVVLNAVGKRSFARCRRLLRPGDLRLVRPGPALPEPRQMVGSVVFAVR
jgi:hypothetical protein